MAQDFLWGLFLGCQKVYLVENFVIIYSVYPSREKATKTCLFFYIYLYILKSNRLNFLYG